MSLKLKEYLRIGGLVAAIGLTTYANFALNISDKIRNGVKNALHSGHLSHERVEGDVLEDCILVRQRTDESQLGYLLASVYACPEDRLVLTHQIIQGQNENGWWVLNPPVAYTVVTPESEERYTDVAQDGWNGNEVLEERVEADG